MASSSVQNVDDLIHCLMGMGFEFTDCQEAIQIGKLTVEEVVEWILAGKPSPQETSSASSLRLRRNEEGGLSRLENPFVPEGQPEVIPRPSALDAFSPPNPTHDDSPGKDPPPRAEGAPQGKGSPVEGTDLVSRMHMNDEQRKVKLRFEEKQRDEARKDAHRNKVLQKQAKEQALRSIAEDKERRKMKNQAKPAQSAESLASPTEPSQSTSQKPAAAAAHSDKSLLQIRLPNGRALRQTFQASAVLQDVWDYVTAECKECDNTFHLMQPFPRKEFSASDHMKRTLQELQLTPSGSLVLKKSDKAVEEAAPNNPDVEMQEDESPPARIGAPVPHHPPGMGLDQVLMGPGRGGGHPLGGGGPPIHQGQGRGGGHPLGGAGQPMHQWGAGQNLGDNEDNADVAPEPMQVAEPEPEHFPIEDQADSDEEDEGYDMPNNMNQMIPGVPGMGWGQGQGQGGMGGPPIGMWNPGMGGHQWGEGHRMVEEDGQQQPEQPVQQLAVEAARRRLAEAPRQPLDKTSPPAPLHDCHPLLQLCMKHLTSRICDPRTQMTLSGLPEGLAERFLVHLIKEKLLRPKTLQLFLSCHLRKVVLDCYPYATNELLTALRFHSNVAHLSLCYCPLITDRGLQPLASLKRLKTLNLGNCKQITNNCVQVLRELPNLVTVNLEDTQISDEGVMLWTAVHEQPDCLQSLNLNRTAVTHEVLRLLKAFTSLRNLSLEGTRVSSLSGVDMISKLESLNVASTQIVTESLICLRRCQNLSALNIAKTQNVHGDSALQNLLGLRLCLLQLPMRHSTTVAGLSNLTEMPLRELDLTNYTNVGDECMQYIGQIKSLRKLRLGNTRITEAGLGFLDGLSQLEVLSLDRTLVGDGSASAFCAFKQLQELSLSETSITTKFLKTASLNNCVHLSKLNLSRTSITTKGVECLILPNLKLLNLDGTCVKQTVEAVVRKNCPNIARISMKALIQPPENEENN